MALTKETFIAMRGVKVDRGLDEIRAGANVSGNVKRSQSVMKSRM